MCVCDAFLCVEEEDAADVQRPIAVPHTFSKPEWFDAVNEEYTACREAVGLIDYSAYTKIDIWVILRNKVPPSHLLNLLWRLTGCASLFFCFPQSKGREVVDSLQYLCSNDVDVPPGSIIHTGLQNERGGYENDCSIVRVSENLLVGCDLWCGGGRIRRR